MNKEESMLQKRLVELSRLAYNRGIVIFSDFLNLNELNILVSQIVYLVDLFPYLLYKLLHMGLLQIYTKYFLESTAVFLSNSEVSSRKRPDTFL